MGCAKGATKLLPLRQAPSANRQRPAMSRAWMQRLITRGSPTPSPAPTSAAVPLPGGVVSAVILGVGPLVANRVTRALQFVVRRVGGGRLGARRRFENRLRVGGVENIGANKLSE